MLLGGDRERAEDDYEHEQVVDRQALFDHVPGEVLGAEIPAGDQGKLIPQVGAVTCNVRLPSRLEDRGDAVERGGSKGQFERDSAGREEQPEQCDEDVFEEHAERQDDHAEGG